MPTLQQEIKLGTAIFKEGASERRAMVALMPGTNRVVDLNHVERLRLTKLGEGRADALADVLVPTSLRQLLESGHRGIQRVAQTLAYAEKWHRKSGLPERLAPTIGTFKQLPCLPRPLSLKTSLGHFLDRVNIHGSGATLPAIPEPTIAIVGSTDTKYAGYCIAATSLIGTILGSWLCIGQLQQGEISVGIGTNIASASIDTWADLMPPKLYPAEVLFLPPPMFRTPTVVSAGEKIVIETYFDRLEFTLEPEPLHPIVQ
ncbi:MAG: hypothetical protein FWG02_08570 [Holophagaceae bacterium]|nr:hypothetical protein [Holophagaceae bacterium]